MRTDEQMKALISSLSTGISAESLQLSIIQGLIAAEISMKRQELGLNQKQLAEKIGVTQGLVSRWERGETNFNLSTLVRIASALDLKMQSPIVPAPPIAYPVGSSNIVHVSTSSHWNSGSYSLDTKFHSSSSENDELEEM